MGNVRRIYVEKKAPYAVKAKELKAMSNTELEAKVSELKAELFNLRFQLATGQLQNTTVIANTKRDIARCMTILRQNELKDAQ